MMDEILRQTLTDMFTILQALQNARVFPSYLQRRKPYQYNQRPHAATPEPTTNTDLLEDPDHPVIESGVVLYCVKASIFIHHPRFGRILATLHEHNTRKIQPKKGVESASTS